MILCSLRGLRRVPHLRVGVRRKGQAGERHNIFSLQRSEVKRRNGKQKLRLSRFKSTPSARALPNAGLAHVVGIDRHEGRRQRVRFFRLLPRRTFRACMHLKHLSASAFQSGLCQPKQEGCPSHCKLTSVCYELISVIKAIARPKPYI